MCIHLVNAFEDSLFEFVGRVDSDMAQERTGQRKRAPASTQALITSELDGTRRLASAQSRRAARASRQTKALGARRRELRNATGRSGPGRGGGNPARAFRAALRARVQARDLRAADQGRTILERAGLSSWRKTTRIPRLPGCGRRCRSALPKFAKRSSTALDAPVLLRMPPTGRSEWRSACLSLSARFDRARSEEGQSPMGRPRHPRASAAARPRLCRTARCRCPGRSDGPSADTRPPDRDA